MRLCFFTSTLTTGCSAMMELYIEMLCHAFVGLTCVVQYVNPSCVDQCSSSPCHDHGLSINLSKLPMSGSSSYDTPSVLP